MIPMSHEHHPHITHHTTTVAPPAALAACLPTLRDPERVALAYTEDSEWRNRAEFLKGREAIKEVSGMHVTWTCCGVLPVCMLSKVCRHV